MGRLVFALIVSGLIFGSAYDAKAQTILYPGSLADCGNWLDARGYNMTEENQMLAWFLGYLSGVRGTRAYTNNDPDYLGGFSGDAFRTWLDKYCSANTFNSLQRAGDELTDELIERAKR